MKNWNVDFTREAEKDLDTFSASTQKQIIVIAARADDEVYDIAAKRTSGV